MPKLPFNDRSVQSATFEGSGNETEYTFDNLAGLVLHVSAGGKKTWKAHYSHTTGSVRRKRKVKLGTYPKLGLAKAKREAERILERVDMEGDIVALDAAQAETAALNGLTFADLVDEYLAMSQDLARLKEIERELRKDAVPELGRKRPGEITTADIDELGQAIIARGAPAMARRLIVRLKALFNFCLLDHPALATKYGISINPAAPLGRRRRRGSARGYADSEPRDRVLSDTEIAEWWKALDASDKRALTKLALKLVLVTAQRPGEVRQARRGDLKLRGQAPSWLIPAEHSKNRRQHDVPLSQLAVALFKAALELSPSPEHVFPDPKEASTPISEVALPTAQASLFRALPKLKPATVHDLRRTAATGMRRIGVPPYDVSLVLNHTRQDVTGMHYDHHEGHQEKREALQRWADHLAKICFRE